MSLLAAISLALSLIIIFRAGQNLRNLFVSFHWLRSKKIAKSRPRAKFFVCIPVLDEQDIITHTLDSFFEQSYPRDLISIYVVTTAREKASTKRPSTKNVVEQYVKTLNKSDARRIHILQYPDKNGRMAHQINYAADYLHAELSQINSYFVVYNADSHIHADTLKLANRVIVTVPHQPTILQQSAVYQYTGESALAEGAGLHQTLWTLTHEIPKLLAQSSRVVHLPRSHSNIRQLLQYSRIAHCVGHGLFVRGDYYQLHPLPQGILNEDMPYGLQACALHEPIYSIPSLELASTPAKTINVYRQKSVWFNPFFEFLGYGRTLVHQKAYFSKLEIVWLLMQAYAPLIIWFLHSTVLLGGFVVSIVAGWMYVVVWFVAFNLYWTLPALIITKHRLNLANGGSNTYLSVFAGIPYVLTHSVGPYISVWRWVMAGIKQVQPDKPKTETN